jgi:F-box and leucine-rich repeat protein 10/11
MEMDPTRVITFKAPARKSTRKRTRRDYANLNSGQGSDPNRWMRILEGKTIKDDPFQRPKGSVVGLEWLAEGEGAMKEPIVIESPDGLGMKMPPNDFTVEDVVQLIGDNVPVEVIGLSYIYLRTFLS